MATDVHAAAPRSCGPQVMVDVFLLSPLQSSSECGTPEVSALVLDSGAGEAQASA